ncbi:MULTISPECIES: iron uptake transporter permease EfeU [unclassified Pseudomonas]|uniref:iron uptake transporter permease EfeU n=1 Tax=unclassified Pseudomonas TaxID=196821 RepID=UPI0002A1A85F|nr:MULTISPECIES: iron uptake transporter permease EfeU [unclassified Pseudomonas]MBB1609306.1 iron transporter [Pseudomonas sp. UMC76]MBB1638248.1 iron transporter [Pseudomonas sp. UME83]NTX93296.1 iron transporter [Pseudomonas sp. UMA643]NTY16867.1 iron transporter [Pseudomonas sp. UMC3103]NTY23030.1 iron transporter [Pseudomonas sp. UMA603]
MLVPFLIMLREGMEAALIVGIIASYLRRTGRAHWMPAVWIGVFLAAALALFVGAGLELASAEFPQKQQELFEALVGLAAVAILTSMVFWMRKMARSIKGELQAALDHAFHSRHQGYALIAMVFLAVAREGLETVFFLLAVFQQSEGPGAPLGALLGLALAVALGYGIYSGGVRLNLARFFRWTGLFILVVAAGILANAVRSLHEAGVWNLLQAPLWDSGASLPEDGALGSLLAGLFGYQQSPTLSTLGAWLAYLALSLTLFFLPPRPAAPARSTAE